VTLRPRPFRGSAPLLLRASSSIESLRQAARDGVPVMFGLAATAQIAERIAAYRACAADLGRPAAEIDRQVAEFRVLRRVVVAAGDDDALADARQALRWEARTARRVHRPAGDGSPARGSGEEGDAGDAGGGGVGGATAGTGEAGRGAKLADGSDPHPAAEAADAADAAEVAGGCVGTPRTVLRELAALRALGIRHVIAWLNFGDLPYSKVRRSMELLRDEVIPALAGEEPPYPAHAGLASAGRLDRTMLRAKSTSA